jgi:hypothetical protein
VARLGAVELEAEAEPRPAFLGQHARDEHLLAGGEAERLRVDELQINGLSPLRTTRP